MTRRAPRARNVLAAAAALALGSTAACGISAIGSLEGRADGGTTAGIDGGPLPIDGAADDDAGGADGEALPDGAAGDAAPPVVRDDAGCPTGRGPPMLRLFGGTSPALCIDQTEVSARQYMPFVAEFAAGRTPLQSVVCAINTSVLPLDMTSATTPPLDSDDPVDRIDWCDASLFCEWAGKRLCARRNGTRTYIGEDDSDDATIDEWFAACSQDGAQNGVPAQANLAANSIANRNADDQVLVTAPPPGGPTYPAGLLRHIVGNVEEWVDGCDGLGNCVARGASVKTTTTTDCRTRTVHPRMDRKADLGFRCCAKPVP